MNPQNSPPHTLLRDTGLKMRCCFLYFLFLSYLSWVFLLDFMHYHTAHKVTSCCLTLPLVGNKQKWVPLMIDVNTAGPGEHLAPRGNRRQKDPQRMSFSHRNELQGDAQTARVAGAPCRFCFYITGQMMCGFSVYCEMGNVPI